MQIKKTIIIAKQFTRTPGARYNEDGDNSAQKFLEEILIPELDMAIESGYKIGIDLDGVRGYPSSFISGSFGKLSIERGSDILLKYIEFFSLKSSTRVEEFIHEIKYPKTHEE